MRSSSTPPSSYFWLTLLACGIFTGILASFVDVTTELLADLRFGRCERGFWLTRRVCCLEAFNSSHCLLLEGGWKEWVPSSDVDWAAAFASSTTIGLFFSLLAAWIVRSLSPFAAGSGIPEVKTLLSDAELKGFLSGWTLLAKTSSLVLSVSAGLCLGKEGPFVHLSCCVARQLLRLVPSLRKSPLARMEVYSAAAAAGVAVAFGAPIGGVLFSLEEVSSFFPAKTLWRTFFCALSAAFTLQLVDPLGTGKLVLFEVTSHHRWQIAECVVFLAIGILGGVIGSGFLALNTAVVKIRKSKWKSFPVLEVCLLSMFTSAISFSSPLLLSSGTSFLSSLFQECSDLQEEGDVKEWLCPSSSHSASSLIFVLFAVAAIKLILTSFTFGAKIAAGLFIPSLCVGGAIGRGVGIAVQLATSDGSTFAMLCASSTRCILPSLYAIVGAAAVLAGVTRMTISLVVIVFELTGGLEVILPAMLAIVSAKVVSELISGSHSVYDRVIEEEKYPYLDTKEDLPDTIRTVSDLLSEVDLFVVSAVEEVEQLKQKIKEVKRKGEAGVAVVHSLTDMAPVGYVPLLLCVACLHIVSCPCSRFAFISSIEAALASCGEEERFLDNEELCIAPPSSVGLRRVAAFAPPRGMRDSFLDLSHTLDSAPVTVFSYSPLKDVLELMRKQHRRYVLVLSRGRVVGTVSRLRAVEVCREERALAASLRRAEARTRGESTSVVRHFVAFASRMLKCLLPSRGRNRRGIGDDGL